MKYYYLIIMHSSIIHKYTNKNNIQGVFILKINLNDPSYDAANGNSFCI